LRKKAKSSKLITMKSLKVIIILLGIIIILPALGHLIWMVQKKQELNLLIVNKSVEESSQNEVKTLNWVLNFDKVLKNNDDHYDFTSDYYGFHPDAVTEDRSIRAYKLEDFSFIHENYDGLIFLDNNGVELNTSNSTLDYYGGLNQTDFLLIKDMIDSSKMVVAEFNFFSEHTDDLVRYNTETLLDIYTLRWKGKYFKDLSRKALEDEIDTAWFSTYSDFYEKQWDFSGEGLIMYNYKNDYILVLPAREYMDANGLTIETCESAVNDYGLPEEASYDGWFEVVYEGENEVLSTLNPNLNEEGKELFLKNGLDPVFPVSIKMKDKPVYFLAGDFSKQNVFLSSSRVRIVSDACRLICKGMTSNPRRFFHTYYVPFMSGILKEYENGAKTSGV